MESLKLEPVACELGMVNQGPIPVGELPGKMLKCLTMPQGGPAKSSDKLVMIVDDDDSIRELLEFMVKQEGFRVETAGDGEEGLRKIQALNPDLVILDLMMPRYGGFEVLRQLQSGQSEGIPILIITGRYTDQMSMEMLRHESNVRDIMEKPVQASVLASNLHNILGTTPPESDGAD